MQYVLTQVGDWQQTAPPAGILDYRTPAMFAAGATVDPAKPFQLLAAFRDGVDLSAVPGVAMGSGDCRELSLSQLQRNAWQLNIGPVIGDRLAATAAMALLRSAGSSGDNGPRVFVPEWDRLTVYLGSTTPIYDATIDAADAAWQTMLALMQVEFERQTESMRATRDQLLLRAQQLTTAGQTAAAAAVTAAAARYAEDRVARQALTWLSQQWEVPPAVIAARIELAGAPLPPATVLTETFEGTASSTLGPVYAWTEFGGTAIAIDGSGNVHLSSPTNWTQYVARCDTAVSAADHWATLTQISYNPSAANYPMLGPVVRMTAGGGADGYGARSIETNGAGYATIGKITNLNFAPDLGVAAANGTANTELQVKWLGSNGYLYRNSSATPAATATDTSYPSGLWGGIWMDTGNSAYIPRAGGWTHDDGIPNPPSGGGGVDRIASLCQRLAL